MIATKKEAQAALNAARTKAQNASEMVTKAYVATGGNQLFDVEYSAAKAYYDRCIRDLEEAINAYAPYDNEADE